MPFIHSLNETKELIAAIGTGNVGIQLDSWHWFTADETVADLLTLRNEDIITVDLNDAPQGIALDKQIDSARELPAATGVIPTSPFSMHCGRLATMARFMRSHSMRPCVPCHARKPAPPRLLR